MIEGWLSDSGIKNSECKRAFFSYELIFSIPLS